MLQQCILFLKGIPGVVLRQSTDNPPLLPLIALTFPGQDNVHLLPIYTFPTWFYDTKIVHHLVRLHFKHFGSQPELNCEYLKRSNFLIEENPFYKWARSRVACNLWFTQDYFNSLKTCHIFLEAEVTSVLAWDHTEMAAWWSRICVIIFFCWIRATWMTPSACAAAASAQPQWRRSLKSLYQTGAQNVLQMLPEQSVPSAGTQCW